MNERKRKIPTSHDLDIWQRVNEDLLDWLYTGITGRFQIRGHQQIGKWSEKWIGKAILEVGCGHGHHLQYANHLHPTYIGLDIEYKFVDVLRRRFPSTKVINGDAYHLPFQTHSVDCIISVYNLEHMHELFLCLNEFNRVLNPKGELLVGLPMEGGLLYNLGRKFSSKPYMERKYGIDYDAIVSWEHWNTYREIINLLNIARFQIIEQHFLPFDYLPSVHANVISCIRLRPALVKVE